MMDSVGKSLPPRVTADIMNTYGLLWIFYTSFGAFFYGYSPGLTTSIIGYPELITYFGVGSTTLSALSPVY